MFSLEKKISFQDESRKEILETLRQTQKDLDYAYSNFQYVIEPELIDCYIYQFNAMQLKHQYLLRLLKENNYTRKPLELSES